MKRLFLAFAAVGTLSLAGCSQPAEDTASAAPEAGSQTLAAMISDEGDFSTVAGAMRDTGLAEVFDGTAAYTVLLPTDKAFEALGEDAELITGEAQQAAMVAVLRDHIVPGTFTPADIATAIDSAAQGSVVMTSMGDHDITFSRSGDTITVTSADGSTARLSGDAKQGANGVLIPLDAVLKKV